MSKHNLFSYYFTDRLGGGTYFPLLGMNDASGLFFAGVMVGSETQVRCTVFLVTTGPSQTLTWQQSENTRTDQPC